MFFYYDNPPENPIPTMEAPTLDKVKARPVLQSGSRAL